MPPRRKLNKQGRGGSRVKLRQGKSQGRKKRRSKREKGTRRKVDLRVKYRIPKM